MNRTPVLLLSPFSGDRKRNIAYAHDCLLNSIHLGEAPFASHLIYPQVLNDDIPDDRNRGFECEFAWLPSADKVVAYIDLGRSPGMNLTIERARAHGLIVYFRSLGGLWAE